METRYVLATGHFDMMHAGQIDYLRKAKRLGTYLYVGLTSDEYTRSKKGHGYPIYPMRDRAMILTELKCVNEVIPIPGDNAEEFQAGIDNFLEGTLVHVITCGWEHTADYWARELARKYDCIYAVIDAEGRPHASDIIKKIKDLPDQWLPL